MDDYISISLEEYRNLVGMHAKMGTVVEIVNQDKYIALQTLLAIIGTERANEVSNELKKGKGEE